MLAPVDVLDKVITDSGVELEERGIQVIVVEPMTEVVPVT